MKLIHELLKLVLKHFDEDEFHSGLCLLFINMERSDKITRSEHNMLLAYLIYNRPRGSDPKAHYWKRAEKKWRRVWLNKHIKLTMFSIGKTKNNVFPNILETL